MRGRHTRGQINGSTTNHPWNVSWNWGSSKRSGIRCLIVIVVQEVWHTAADRWKIGAVGQCCLSASTFISERPHHMYYVEFLTNILYMQCDSLCERRGSLDPGIFSFLPYQKGYIYLERAPIISLCLMILCLSWCGASWLYNTGIRRSLSQHVVLVWRVPCRVCRLQVYALF